MLVHLFGVPHLFLVMFDLALIIIIIIIMIIIIIIIIIMIIIIIIIIITCLNRMTISVIKTAINMGPV